MKHNQDINPYIGKMLINNTLVNQRIKSYSVWVSPKKLCGKFCGKWKKPLTKTLV